MTQSKQRDSLPIPKYLIQLLLEILSERNRPIGIADLLDMAVAIRGEIQVEFVEKRFYVFSRREDSPFFVVEYPGFKLRSASKLPDLSNVSRGLKYLTYASKILVYSREYIDVREIVNRIEEKNLYKFPTETPEYWMYVRLNHHKKFFLQKGTLMIGLKQWQQGKVSAQSGNRREFPIEKDVALMIKTNDEITRNIYEANLESVVIEHIEKVEEGLQPIERQRVCVINHRKASKSERMPV